METIRFKTIEEFIEAVMSGRMFKDNEDSLYYYDNTKDNPFRTNDTDLWGNWRYVATEEFTEVLPEPIIEKRWKIRRDNENATWESSRFNNQKYIDEYFKEEDGFYKAEMIEVEIKDDY